MLRLIVMGLDFSLTFSRSRNVIYITHFSFEQAVPSMDVNVEILAHSQQLLFGS